jgi:hypothetical protein
VIRCNDHLTGNASLGAGTVHHINKEILHCKEERAFSLPDLAHIAVDNDPIADVTNGNRNRKTGVRSQASVTQDHGRTSKLEFASLKTEFDTVVISHHPNLTAEGFVMQTEISAAEAMYVKGLYHA